MTATLAASQLAAAPLPPIPALDRPLAPAELEEALRSFHGSYYVQHPFHQLMHEGTLTPRQFQGWVANRLAYQRVVPRKDAAILSNCPDPDVRREWLQRIVDHDGTEPGTGGIEMWIRLGVALGVPREEMEDERHVLPGGPPHLRVVRHVLQDQAVDRGGRLVADRALRADDPPAADRGISRATTRGSRPKALDYFKSRLVQAPRDVRHGLAIVQRHCTTVETQRRAFEALAFKLEMLWAMIDTIHHAYRGVGRPMDGRAASMMDPGPSRGSGGSRGSTTIRCAGGPCCCIPEGAVLLNDTGKAILELWTGGAPSRRSPRSWASATGRRDRGRHRVSVGPRGEGADP